MRRRSPTRRGFNLLEVMIALAVLAVTMTALLAAQSSSLDKSARARNLSIATLLARGKMIDLELLLFDEGFTEGSQEDSGDFRDEDHREIRWSSKISEIELDLNGLSSMCGGFAGDEAEDVQDQEGGCQAMFDGFGGALEGLTSEVAQSIRLVQLNIEWGDKKTVDGGFSIRGLVIRDDYKIGVPAAPAATPGTPPLSGRGS